jgi:hypothetical protein
MLKVFISIFCLTFLLLQESCKSKQPVPTTTTATETAPVAKPKTIGKVSHAYQAGGCGTVVVIPNAGGDPLILIPATPLNEMDVEGLEIEFHYHPLKRKNPPGCTTGSPAELSDITRK